MKYDIEIPQKKEKENVFAYNNEYKEIHISKAESGKKGYYCLGCEAEMVAVLPKKYVSYFRHYPEDVKGNRKCTYSDETYRHKLAKDILQRLKRVKVPSLYKYPPIGLEANPNFISNAKYIEAVSVGVERTIYEDSEGNVLWGRNIEVNEKFLLFKPDITFFDLNNKPILLIEIVATHKINYDKLVKIKRIGIDTIQINIPKSSAEEIEAVFSNTTRTKWIYNYEQEHTEFVSTPNRNTTPLSSIDENQRKFFDESFKCRAAEINNLIRSIKRSLESEPYRKTEEEFRSELQRIESNTTSNRERLQSLQNKHRAGIENQFRERRTKLYLDRKKLQEKDNDLERRYLDKRGKLQQSTNSLEEEINREDERITGATESVESRRRTLVEQTNRIREAIRDQRDRARKFDESRKRFAKEFEQKEINIESSFNKSIETKRREVELLSETIGNIEEIALNQIKQLEEYEERELKRIEDTKRELAIKRSRLTEQFENKRSELELKDNQIRESTYLSNETQDSGRSEHFTREFKEINKYRADLNVYQETYLINRRNRTAWEKCQELAFKKKSK